MAAETTLSRVRRSGIVLPGVLAAGALAILLGLGIWQLDRLAWKQELIAMTASRTAGPPSLVPSAGEWSALDPESYAYRPVYLEGEFVHAAEMHAYTSLSSPRGRFRGPGWWVMTPMRLEGGGTVIVNRGFVPEGRQDPATRAEGQVAGVVRIEGLMMPPEDAGPFVPDDQPADNVWFTRDPAAMAAAAGLEPPVAPFYVDARETAPGGLPQGGETIVTFRNDHLGYALTWFGLACTLIGVYAAWAWGRLAAARPSS